LIRIDEPENGKSPPDTERFGHVTTALIYGSPAPEILNRQAIRIMAASRWPQRLDLRAARHQRLDLGSRQVFARSSNCGIYDGWRRVAVCT
jgi:hypothetical protein